MKKIFILLISASFIIQTEAQKDFNDSIRISRNHLTKNVMIVLGSWSAVNIASGFILADRTNGEAKYFWRMNAYWNFINLGLAGLGYAGVRQAINAHYGFTENYKAQHAMEKLYLFNMGLDLAYIAGGFYLRERGYRETDPRKQDQFRGYGSSIAVQGGFLLLMDCVMYALHHKNTGRMNNKLQRFEIIAAPGGLGINYTF